MKEYLKQGFGLSVGVLFWNRVCENHRRNGSEEVGEEKGKQGTYEN